MKSKRFAVILTAVLTLGAVTPALAYGAASPQSADAAWECRNPENCRRCDSGDCPVCTGQGCGICGGTVDEGICTECGKEQRHSCRNTENSNARRNGHHSGKGQGSSSHHGNGHRGSRGRHC